VCVDLPTLGAQLTIMLFFGNMFGTFVSVIKCETGFGIVQMNPNELWIAFKMFELNTKLVCDFQHVCISCSCYIYILASLAWFIQDLQFSGVVLGFGRDGSTTNRLFHVILGFQGWHYWQVGTTGTWQGTCALLLLLAELQSWVKLIPITMFEKYAIMITVKVRSIIALEIMWQES